MKPGRLDVGIVGAGRVGVVVGAALREAGHRVVAASGVSEASVTRIDALLPGVPRVDPEAVVRAADLIVIAVPDDALSDVVSGLAAVGAWRVGQIAVHTSGRYGLAPLAPAARLGVTGIALHPAMTFTGTSLDLTRMRDAVFAVTAPPPVLPIGLALAVELGGEGVVVDDAMRPLYHAALVQGANHVVGAVAQSLKLLAEAGIEAPTRVLGPLLRASIEGALADAPGSLATLTGPVVRGDAGTIRAHMDALVAHPEELATYRELAGVIARLARDGGRLDAAQYSGVMKALATD